MIARMWRGWTTPADADAYHRYMRDTGVRGLEDTPGNRGVYMLRRVNGGRAEFLMLSLWDSMDGVRAFAGEDPERAVFYPDDGRYLVDREERVTHFEVLEAPGRV
jgi:heme-degrading monooxygenase HmoA